MFAVPASFSFLTLLALIAALIIKSKRDQLTQWKAFAAEHGLECTDPLIRRPKLSGTTQGLTVAVDIYQPQSVRSGKKRSRSRARTRLQASTRLALPAGTLLRREGTLEAVARMLGEEEIEIGDPALDSALWVRCSSPEAIREILEEPTLRASLPELRRNTSIRAETVTLDARGQGRAQLDALLIEALELTALLACARRYPWAQAAAALGLTMSEEDGCLVLVGTHAGIAVTLSVALREDVLTITAPLSGMPAGLSVTAGGEGGLSLGDPILDGAVTVRGQDPGAIRARLRDDAVRGVLLAVVHAWPESSVTADAITLIRPGSMVAGLAERLEEVTTLARLISEPR